MRQGEIAELNPASLATLAGDLSLLVDRLQADWDECRMVRADTAQDLHDIRKRAEHLLCGG